ncbi:hypothetical protein D3C71_1974510 [compost metagenome]
MQALVASAQVSNKAIRSGLHIGFVLFVLGGHGAGLGGVGAFGGDDGLRMVQFFAGTVALTFGTITRSGRVVRCALCDGQTAALPHDYSEQNQQ